MVEESSQSTKHANKILVLIFFSMTATIIGTRFVKEFPSTFGNPARFN